RQQAKRFLFSGAMLGWVASASCASPGANAVLHDWAESVAGALRPVGESNEPVIRLLSKSHCANITAISEDQYAGARRLVYASLFEGRAIFSHAGSPEPGVSQLYAFAPCQTPEPLGSCSAHEVF